MRDIEAAIAFFTDLGLSVVGRTTVSGEWADTAVGLDGNHARIAMLQTPDHLPSWSERHLVMLAQDLQATADASADVHTSE